MSGNQYVDVMIILAAWVIGIAHGLIVAWTHWGRRK